MESNIQLYVKKNMFDAFTNLNDNTRTVKALLQKTAISNDLNACVDALVMTKNISCIMRESMCKMYVAEKNKKNDPVIKVLEESFINSYRAMVFESNSPFKLDFEEKLLLIHQNGLMTKWDRELPYFQKNAPRIDILENEFHLLFNLMLMVLIGYGCSIIVFACEHLLPWVEKFLHCKIVFWC